MGIASRLANAADQIGEVEGRLESKDLDSSWTGQAADAFRATLAKLPSELSKAAQAFSDASRALRSFATTLADLQEKAAWYNRQLEAAEREREEAEARREQADYELHAARLRHDAATDPASLSAARDAVSYGESLVSQAASNVEQAAGRVGQLNAASRVLHEEYERAVDACCGALGTARHSGSHSVLGAIAHGFGAFGHFVGHEAGVVWHGAQEGAAEAVQELDKGWEEVRKPLVVLNEVLSIGAGVLAVGAPVLALLAATTGVGVAFVPVILAIGEVGAEDLNAASKVDQGVLLAGDELAANVAGDRKAAKRVNEDIVGFGGSLIPGEKLVGGVAGKLAPKVEKDLPEIAKATDKMTGRLASKVGAKRVASGIVAAEEGGKALGARAIDKGDDMLKDVAKRLPPALISPPLPEPLTLRIGLTPLPV